MTDSELQTILEYIDSEITRLLHGADPVLMQGLLDWSRLAAVGEW